MSNRWLLLALCLLPLACQRAADPPAAPAAPEAVTLGDQSRAPLRSGPGRGAPVDPDDPIKGTYWPPAKLDGGVATISCSQDYANNGDGEPLESLEFFSLVDALRVCQPEGVVRLRYRGKTGAGFTALVQRVAAMADRMEIPTRILDLDSPGGHVEEAIRAGDAIAESHWTIWIRDDSVCHSACVLVLAAGDMRSITGKVGIHRLMRDRSSATSRAELSAELRAINGQVRDYLERNGVATAVADQMMTVANRDLRILSADELKEYGLTGPNAAQDDLDRIRLGRKCGEDFVRRRDAFRRDFDKQCMETGKSFQSMAECGLALRPRYGFPDARCAQDSPMSEYDRYPGRLKTDDAVPAQAAAGARAERG
ncbi:hypothetical protein [Lysobacter silvisoli]|uniref:Peptidase S49 domain-containing protein n=1 Tax=Lysobacter silvisoli TaxID=2293254 RepID=A0A371JZ72_9GAMM|nr:hypothetical protein [Lysobacter silvisoli]RDZ26975.1 hypothetical protein DX914_11935 [Lysobacter silvisoli]